MRVAAAAVVAAEVVDQRVQAQYALVPAEVVRAGQADVVVALQAEPAVEAAAVVAAAQ